MRLLLVALCVAFWTFVAGAIAILASGCITTTTTLPDGTMVTSSTIDWGRVQEAAEHLSPYALAAIDSARNWQAAQEARDTAETAAEQDWRDKQVAFVAGSVAFGAAYRQGVLSGATPRVAAMTAVARADDVVRAMCRGSGVDQTYMSLAREMVWSGPDDLDLPDDGDLALQVLRDYLADVLAEKASP